MWNSSYSFRTGGEREGERKDKEEQGEKKTYKCNYGNSIRETLTRMEFVYVCIGHWQREEREREEGNVPAQSCP